MRTKMIMNTVRETAHNYSCQHPEGKTIHRSPLTLFSVKVPPCHSHLLASDRGTCNSCSVVGWNTIRVKNPELSFYKLVNQQRANAKVETGNEMSGISRKNRKTIIIQLVTVTKLFKVSLPPPKLHVVARVCLFGWLVCQQNYTKTTERIYTKLRWRMSLVWEYMWLIFGADTDKGKSQDNFSLFWDLDIFVNFWGSLHGSLKKNLIKCVRDPIKITNLVY